MKSPFALLLVVLWLALPLAKARADDADLAAARTALLKGRYVTASEQFTVLAERDPAAAIGLARSLAAVGKRDEAGAALEAGAKRFAGSAAIQAELAQAAIDRGDYEAAERHKAKALELDKDCVAARWVDAQLFKAAGKLPEAERALSWFTQHYNRSPRVDEPDDLLTIARGVAEHARWTRSSNQFRRILSKLFPAALAREPNYWPARLEAERGRCGDGDYRRAGDQSAGGRAARGASGLGAGFLRPGDREDLARSGPGDQSAACLGASASGGLAVCRRAAGGSDRYLGRGPEVESTR
jgi:tetratricopeptide (TPR) repeat protein